MRFIDSLLEKYRLHTIKKVFQQLYVNTNGALIAAKEKKTKGLTYSPDFVYGEILLDSFLETLNLCHPSEHDVFFDLGSGTGKAVIAAALFQPKMVCYGIEKLSSLYQCSCQQAQQLVHLCSQHKVSLGTIEFKHEDFLCSDLQSATLLFVNATSLIGDSWQQLQIKLQQLRTKTRIIVISKQLKTPEFKLLHQSPCDMSWGTSYVFIYQKQ